jgi:hypothetical protein
VSLLCQAAGKSYLCSILFCLNVGKCDLCQAAVVYPAATMTCIGRPDHDDLFRRKSCISPLRSSSSKSKLSVLPCKGSTAWHRPAWASWGCRDEVFMVALGWNQSLARGRVMMTTSMGNLDDDPRSWWCAFVLIARLAMCALEIVVFHDGRQGCMYRF